LRDERDPWGPIKAMLVEETFRRTAVVLHVHDDRGTVLRTTPEHPFWVENKGWTQAGVLEPGDRLRTANGWTIVTELFDTGDYETVYNVRVADYHTYFVSDHPAGDGVWAHNTYDLVREAKGGRVFRFTEAGGYSAEWFVPTSKLTKKFTPTKEVQDAVKQDAELGLGNALQAQVTQYANDWHNLPASSKAVDGRESAIRGAVGDANAIYQQLGMPTVSYDDYVNGASLPHIPSTRPPSLPMTDEEYSALKVRHGKALKTANQQRAAAKGDWIHNKIEIYGEDHGYRYFSQGIDLLHISSGLRFEVMVTGAWSDHSGPNFQSAFWRALQY
jgi:hypothetical protein